MPADEATKQKIIDLLIESYNAEIETVMNYLANAVNLEGIRADHIKDSLQTDVTEELGHAQQIAKRVHTLGGVVPGSQALNWTQSAMQPREDTTDLRAVIEGVIAAEEDAIAGYEKIIQVCDGVDFVTQDMAIALLEDEQNHRREFLGYLKEYQKG